jgi:hypothetical protein
VTRHNLPSGSVGYTTLAGSAAPQNGLETLTVLPTWVHAASL